MHNCAKLLFWICLLVCTAIFFSPVGKEIAHLASYSVWTDKVAHFFIFFVLAILLSSAFPFRLSAYVMLVFYAFAVEVVQEMLPWRTFEWMDLLFDLLGVVFGVICWKLIILCKARYSVRLSSK